MNKHTNIKRFLISGLISLFIFVGCKSENGRKQTIDWQTYKNITDSILHSISDQDVKLFIKQENETYKQVVDITKFDESYMTFIKVVVTSEVKIYIEEPNSESGDWNNEYVYVFNQSGKLKLFIRKSSFFNSNCSDGAVTEKEIFAVEDRKLMKENYEIFDENKIAIKDTTNCIFNYRFKYPVYMDYFEIPVVDKYNNILSK